MAFVPLRDASERCGAKAHNLGRLMKAGCNVPAGFVVPDPLRDADWEQEIDHALRALGTGPFAVRSSALAEDGLDASFAGQLVSVLGAATSQEVIEAVSRSAASGTAAGVGAYTTRTGQAPVTRVPVIVQVMVRPEVAGVLFTRHPVTGADQVVIEAVRGLGEAVAAGTVTPQRYLVDGSQVRTAVAHPDGLVLTTAQALTLAETGRRIEALSGIGQDVEWAITGDKVWVLQARPITTHPDTAGTDAPTSGALLLTGTAASPGTATGPARIITGLDDFGRFRPGDVLVCRTTSPAWTPLLARAAAVVTETGGILAHAAIVAREFAIPAVLAVPNGKTTLRDGQLVRVDGTNGHITPALDHES